MYPVITGGHKGCGELLGRWETASLQLFDSGRDSLLVTQLVTTPEQGGGPTELGAADKPSGKTVAGIKKYTDTAVGTVPKAVKMQVHTAGLEKGVRRKQANIAKTCSGNQRGEARSAHLLLKGIY